MTAVFSHGRLRLYLLKLLAEGPKHGYELIRLLENRFLGLYAPSAGTIYPRLQRLEAEGLVSHAAAGGRKVYEITEAGRAELTQRAGELAELEREAGGPGQVGTSRPTPRSNGCSGRSARRPAGSCTGPIPARGRRGPRPPRSPGRWRSYAGFSAPYRATFRQFPGTLQWWHRYGPEDEAHGGKRQRGTIRGCHAVRCGAG